MHSNIYRRGDFVVSAKVGGVSLSNFLSGRARLRPFMKKKIEMKMKTAAARAATEMPTSALALSFSGVFVKNSVGGGPQGSVSVGHCEATSGVAQEAVDVGYRAARRPNSSICHF